MNEQEREHLTRLISLLLDGALFEEEQAELEKKLIEDSEARRIYLSLVDQQIELGYLVPAAEEKVIVKGPWRRWARYMAVAAGIAILIGGLWLAIDKMGSNEPLIVEPEPRPEEPPEHLIAPAPEPAPAPVPPPLPQVEPDTGVIWEPDFSTPQALLGWKGELVTHDLPDGLMAAVQSKVESDPNQPDKKHYVLSTDSNFSGWFDGREDAHVNLIVKANRESWLNVFIGTRTMTSTSDDYGLALWHGGAITQDPGEWKQVSIPLTAFKRKVIDKFVDDQPLTRDDLITGLSFSSYDTGLQLTVARMWVSEDGPGEVTISRL